MSPNPGRPRITVRVGITGHRWNKLSVTNSEAVKSRLSDVLGWIEYLIDNEVYPALQSGYRSPGLTHEPPPLPAFRLISGLAEGADRLAAQVAKDRQIWQLTALLPFPRAEYQKTFVRKRPPGEDGLQADIKEGDRDYVADDLDQQSVDEFARWLETAEEEGGVQELDGKLDDKAKYVPQAIALTHNADLIIAVWNGMEPTKPGGTGDVVSRATELGIPVLRIDPDGQATAWLHTPGDEANARRLGKYASADHLKRLLIAPIPGKSGDLREMYFEEPVPSKKAGWLYDLFLRVFAPTEKQETAPEARREPDHTDEPSRAAPDAEPEPDHVKTLREKWDKEWKNLGACNALRGALIDTGIHKHYAWASLLANYYGGRYRDAFLKSYLLSWLAVVAAAFGVVFHTAGSALWTLLAALVECVLLMSIVYVVWRARARRVHARWLDYRRLAEWLRLLPMLLPLSRTPVLGVQSNTLLSGQESWVQWMLRAVVREAGLLSLDLSRHLHGAREMLVSGMLRGQIRYHERAARRNSTADGVLHQLTGLIFIVALALALVHVADLVLEFFFHQPPLVPDHLAQVLLIPTLTLPALGAALHAIRSQGEFEETATRSEEITSRLEDLQKEMKEVGSPTVGSIANIATETAMVMNAELSGWFVTYQTKGIQLTS